MQLQPTELRLDYDLTATVLRLTAILGDERQSDSPVRASLNRTLCGLSFVGAKADSVRVRSMNHRHNIFDNINQSVSQSIHVHITPSNISETR